MILKSPGSIAFTIGPLIIHWYGIIIATAFITGLTVIIQIAKKQKENPERILDLATYLLIGGVIFARLYYVIFNWKCYNQHFLDIFKVWQGGLSIHGALLGGFLVLLVYAKIYKISLLKYADILSYGGVLGQAIGRWGNFFNSEAFGAPASNLPLKLYIPPEARPLAFSQYNYFHPTFLYESIWDLLVFVILYFLLRKKFSGCNGAIFFSYLILYSSGRFIIESVRIDSINSVLGLPIAQFVSIILIITGITGLYFLNVFKKSL